MYWNWTTKDKNEQNANSTKKRRIQIDFRGFRLIGLKWKEKEKSEFSNNEFPQSIVNCFMLCKMAFCPYFVLFALFSVFCLKKLKKRRNCSKKWMKNKSKNKYIFPRKSKTWKRDMTTKVGVLFYSNIKNTFTLFSPSKFGEHACTAFIFINREKNH